MLVLLTNTENLSPILAETQVTLAPLIPLLLMSPLGALLLAYIAVIESNGQKRPVFLPSPVAESLAAGLILACFAGVITLSMVSNLSLVYAIAAFTFSIATYGLRPFFDRVLENKYPR